ncbi:unnamed protein product [Arctia plantaginis]|uniref:Uncharacterized protein n=1 Tax=Arctia plantaginis TaxID=874455 RepID=A0A8S0ZFT9_ARCPL|nr:unnamed protein product [Arctia plantaginis]
MQDLADHKIKRVVSDNAANIQAAIRLGEWPVGCFAPTLNLIVKNGLKGISEIAGKVKSTVEYFNKMDGANEIRICNYTNGFPDLKIKTRMSNTLESV